MPQKKLLAWVHLDQSEAQSIRNQSLSNFFVTCGQVRCGLQHVTTKFGKLFFSILYAHRKFAKLLTFFDGVSVLSLIHI